jgi:hypothetical protein
MSLNLPSGANFKRAKMLWEIGLNIASNKAIPYGGNRDICVTVGSGAGESFQPSLRIATGSATLAHEVASGGLDLAFINPSGLLTQAYRGTGMFKAPLPIRIIASYPSLDRYAMLIRQGTGLASLAEVKQARYPLQISLREDPTHSTRVLIDQLLAFYDFSLADLESWGGRVHMAGPPGDKRRLAGIKEGWLDAIFDEGIRNWFGIALDAGFAPIELDEPGFAHLEALGWRRAVIGKSWFPQLDRDHHCIDFSGWPLYGRADLPDSVVHEVCTAFVARESEMPWEQGTEGLKQAFIQTEATPMDVPMHPAVERWLADQAF